MAMERVMKPSGLTNFECVCVCVCMCGDNLKFLLELLKGIEFLICLIVVYLKFIK